MSHLSQISRLFRSARALSSDSGGNVAVMFALAMLPLIGFVGAAVDYSRANNARTAMQAALDSTALMLSKDAATLNQLQLTQKANDYFTAMYNHPEAKNVGLTVAYSAAQAGGGQSVDLTSSAQVPAEFMKVLGYDTIPISTISTAAWGATRLRVALALDTTGSMSSDGKMTALKPAAKGLIDQLAALNKSPGDVYVSIVPFSKDVNVGSSNYNATWIKWNSWNNNNQTCTWTKSGQVCTPNNHNTWNGCVMDRDQNYDVSNALPTTITQGTLFWAEQHADCPASLMPLSNNWTDLKAKIDALYPDGNTNQPIGLAWAWQTLSSGPFNYPAEQAGYDYSKVIVLMSDGVNTQNRWSSNVNSINARQAIMCTNAKQAGVIIYAIQVNTSGDPLQTVMQNCASSADKFFYLTSANQLLSVFNQIGQQLSKLRLSH